MIVYGDEIFDLEKPPILNMKENPVELARERKEYSERLGIDSRKGTCLNSPVHDFDIGTFIMNMLTEETSDCEKHEQIIDVDCGTIIHTKSYWKRDIYLVICNGYMYDVLQGISDHAKLQIVLNAVEKGSNPWGCTDYLNQKKKILETGADVYELMNDYPVHTKAVLINDRLSVVGSYNLDMRSTYLDTELMLVIDSEKLSQQIHETESDYMEKSKEVLANGQETEGAKYQGKVLNRKKKLYYGVLRIIIRPLRQLL